MCSTQRMHFRATFALKLRKLYAAGWKLWPSIYADDTGFIFQHKDINIMKHQLNTNFSNICGWFVDYKLSNHFGEDKTKSIRFDPWNLGKKLRQLNISYSLLKIKQCSEVIYLSCILDESLSEESMVLNAVAKINTRLKFL